MSISIILQLDLSCEYLPTKSSLNWSPSLQMILYWLMWEVPSNQVLPRGECRITLVSSIMLPRWILQSVHYTFHSFVIRLFCLIQRRTGFNTGAEFKKAWSWEVEWGGCAEDAMGGSKGQDCQLEPVRACSCKLFFPRFKTISWGCLCLACFAWIEIHNEIVFIFLQCFKWHPSDHGRQMQSIFSVSIIIGCYYFL